MYKTCQKCKRSLPMSDEFFYRIGKNRKYFSSKCKKCYPSGAQGRKKRKMEGRTTSNDVKQTEEFVKHQTRIQDIKTARGCVRCGYNEHPEALDFHHLDESTKLFSLGRAFKRDWTDIEAEIAKCEVVCANCHRVWTSRRRLNS